jgi:hypothetical protein
LAFPLQLYPSSHSKSLPLGICLSADSFSLRSASSIDLLFSMLERGVCEKSPLILLAFSYGRSYTISSAGMIYAGVSGEASK